MTAANQVTLLPWFMKQQNENVTGNDGLKVMGRQGNRKLQHMSMNIMNDILHHEYHDAEIENKLSTHTSLKEKDNICR